MEQSLYLDYVKKTFPLLVTSTAEKINDKRNNAQTYLYRYLLTKEYSVDGRWASILAKYNRVAADVVSLDSSLPIKTGDTVELINGEIPKMGMKMYLTENQMKTIDSLIAQNAGGRFTSTIINNIFTHLPKCIDSIYETIEAIFQSELSSGIGIAPNSTGTGVKIDLKFYDANKKGVTALWNASGSKAIDDLQKIFDKAEEDGNTITDMWADDTFLKAFYANEQVRQQFAFNMGFVGSNIPVLALEQAQDVIRRKWGVELHRISRTIRTELNGVRSNKKAWADGVASFTCDARVGSLIWTNTVESTRPKAGVEYKTVDDFILLSQYAENDPWREFTTSQAMVVPILNNVDRIYLLDSKTVQA